MNRRKFIRNLSLGTAFLWSGKMKSLAAAEVFDLRDQVTLRFVIASDFHYGQPNTAFEEMTDTFIQSVQQFHQQHPLDFCVLNGDIIHNEKKFLPIAKQKFSSLTMPWYVTRGNHDMVTENYWQEV
jgi:metallophosphoesterase superfamily enzyme